MSRPVDTVIQYLEAEQARGNTHIFLDEAARDSMRELYRRLQSGAKSVAKTPPLPAHKTIAPMTPDVVAEKIPASATETTPQPIAPRVAQAGSGTKPERLAALRAQADNWPPAKSLGTLRDTMVFAVGNPDAKIVLVGEAPGFQEEKDREPFVGPAGQKLNDILKAMGLSREEVYITNIVKFRPATARQTTNNRKPTREEMDACLTFVRQEIQVIQPHCIIALGGTAAEGLLGLTGAVGTMRGSWHPFEGIPVRVTYHPSYLLQSGANNSIKRQVWEDMLTVMEKLAMPISEKQRGFFLPKANES